MDTFASTLHKVQTYASSTLVLLYKTSLNDIQYKKSKEKMGGNVIIFIEGAAVRNGESKIQEV